MTQESFADQAAKASQEQGSGFEQPAKTQDQEQQQAKPTDSADAILARLEKRLNDKDEFIDTLKSETKEYRENLAKRDAEIQELREKLEALGSSNSKIDEALKELTQKREVGSADRAEVNLDEVVERATAKMKEDLTAEQRLAAEAANFNQVESAVKETYGEKYLDSLAERCKALDMSLVELDRLAKVSPKAALELLNLKATKTPTPTYGGVNTAAFKEQPQQHKPKSVMGMSNTKQDVAAWNAYKPQ